MRSINKHGWTTRTVTLVCVKGGGKFVLADRDHKRVYQLDRAGQEKARECNSKELRGMDSTLPHLKDSQALLLDS